MGRLLTGIFVALWCALGTGGCGQSKSRAVSVVVRTVSASAGSTVDVPLVISGDAQGTLGIDIIFDYDRQALEFRTVSAGTVTQGWNIVSKDDADRSQTALGMYSTQPLAAGGGSIALLSFAVKADIPAGKAAAVQLKKVSLNEKPVSQLKSGAVKIGR